MDRLISGTYTIVNPRTGGHRTVKVSDDDFSWWSASGRPPVGTRSVKGLNGPDNERSFVYLGTLTPSGQFQPTRRSAEYPTLVAAATWLAKHGAGREASLAKAYALRSGRCSFCARKLTTPDSIANGYGPDCAERYALPYTKGHAKAERVGWQTVAPNPAPIEGATLTTTAPSLRSGRTYRDLFGADD